MDYLILYARLRVRTISIYAFWDGFATNLVKTLIICLALNGHGLVCLIDVTHGVATYNATSTLILLSVNRDVVSVTGGDFDSRN
jgi:hypothetical protein